MLLSEKEKQEMFLAHRKHFEAVCDESSCDRLIPVGELYVVVKWDKRKTGESFLGAQPKKIRCMQCEDVRLGRDIKKEKKEKEGNELGDNVPLIRRRVFKIFKKDPTPIPSVALLGKIKRKYPQFKKSQIRKVLRYMKKEKEIQRKKKLWSLCDSKQSKHKDNAK